MRSLIPLAMASLLIGCSDPNVPTSLTFAEPRSYNFGRTANGFEVVDVDGDGKLDVVGMEMGSNWQAEVKLGRGDGTLGQSQDAPEGYTHFADLDGDGKLDAFRDKTTYIYRSLDTMLGNGDGTFRRGGSTEVKLGKLYTGAADVDGDGYVELLSLDASEVDAAWVSGNGYVLSEKKLFTPPQGTLFQLVAGDLNADKRSDFLLTTAGALFVALSSPDGSYAVNPLDLGTFENIHRPSVIDVNADGRLDIAFFGSESGRNEMSIVALLLDGAGNETRLARSDLGVEVSASGFADIDNDGKIDAYIGLDHASVFAVGKGDGTFDKLLAFDTLPVGSLSFADMNNDNRTDLVIHDAATVNILLAR